MAKLKALVVDDDKIFMEKLGEFLKIGFNCDVTLTSNGSNAISKLDHDDYHILLLDLKMPGVDGFTVLAHAKKVNPRIIVIAISGIVDPVITKRVEEAGAWYMVKPIQLKALEFVLKDLIRKNQ